MRLFEIAGAEDARSVMAVIQGLANDERVPSTLPFSVFKKYINGDEIGIGTPDAVVAFKNTADPTGDIIGNVDTETGTVELNTKTKDSSVKFGDQETGGSPTVDQMASSAAAKNLKSKF